jgi:DNA replication and repair protein RecF
LIAGRSYRTSRLAELPRWDSAAAAASGELVRDNGSTVIRRIVEQLEDGSWRTAGESCEWARVIAFGWHDLAILNGPPMVRRNFLDGVATRLYPGHLATLLRYRKLLGRRAVLLRARRADRLGPWDEILAGEGVELVRRRRMGVAALQTELARIFPMLAGHAHKVEVRYRASLGETASVSDFVAALERGRPEELRRGQTLVGPHRDDLLIELDGVDARLFGSRGQQRLLALALRMAEVLPVREAVGTTPVLLLDDALSELDPRVQSHVLREIRTAGQVFLTSADAVVSGDGAARWEVTGGGVVAA